MLHGGFCQPLSFTILVHSANPPIPAILRARQFSFEIFSCNPSSMLSASGRRVQTSNTSGTSSTNSFTYNYRSSRSTYFNTQIVKLRIPIRLQADLFTKRTMTSLKDSSNSRDQRKTTPCQSSERKLSPAVIPRHLLAPIIVKYILGLQHKFGHCACQECQAPHITPSSEDEPASRPRTLQGCIR